MVISDLTKVEMVSVLAQRRREGAITAGDFALLQNAFLLHVDTQYRAIGIQGAGAPPAGCSHVKDARCDSADMCFIIFNQPVTLARADQNLLAAAAAEGLTTEDPDSHP